MKTVLAIDQGTSGTKAVVVDGVAEDSHEFLPEIRTAWHAGFLGLRPALVRNIARPSSYHVSILRGRKPMASAATQ